MGLFTAAGLGVHPPAPRYLRQFCGENAGGTPKKRRTSDRIAGKVSEVPGEIQIQQSTSN